MLVAVVLIAVIGVMYSWAALRLIIVFAVADVVVAALTNKFVADAYCIYINMTAVASGTPQLRNCSPCIWKTNT